MDYITFALGFIIFLMLMKIFVDSEYFFLTCIVSPIDNEKYCVRQRKNINDAIELLSKMNMKLRKLVDYVNKKHPNKDSVKRLYERYNPQKVIEISPMSQHTAYSENKGEKLAFCLDTEKNSKGRIIDDNTLMYVALHEVSHIATKSIGHGDEFWSNFKFILTESKEINIYNPIDCLKQHFLWKKLQYL